MTSLVWDKVGSRVYENGIDKGVLYLPGGSGVAWNGLTSVVEKFEQNVNSVYFDGSKVNDLVTLGSFAATMKAITYPDEFINIEGVSDSYKKGVHFSDQKIITFGLCYRTMVGNDVDGNESGYKLHIIYNVTAIPSDTTYASFSDDITLVEFEWNITAVPNDIAGFRPTAHIILDSRTIDDILLSNLEDMLYGTDDTDPVLMPMDDLITFINNWIRIDIIDHGDGTWSAVDVYDEHIENVSPQEFKINNCSASYSDSVTYYISDTMEFID